MTAAAAAAAPASQDASYLPPSLPAAGAVRPAYGCSNQPSRITGRELRALVGGLLHRARCVAKLECGDPLFPPATVDCVDADAGEPLAATAERHVEAAVGAAQLLHRSAVSDTGTRGFLPPQAACGVTGAALLEAPTNVLAARVLECS